MSDRKELAMALGAGVALGAIGYGAISAFMSRRRGAGKRVAVIMSGCGVFDGTEVTEAVAVLVALTRNGATPVAFAPDISQVHMIDHAAGERILAPPLSVRSVVSESARITRGAVQKLADLNVDDFDALIFPGGFGVAKNLSNYGTGGGADCKVLDEVSRAVKAFHTAKKPIGFSCIAPVIAARLVKGVTLTMGMAAEGDESWPYSNTIADATKMGANMVETDVGAVVIDRANKIVSTPAYMKATTHSVVFEGVSDMVTSVLNIA